MHKAMQEALESINVCPARREVVLILKINQNQDIDAFWGEDITAL